MNHFEIIPTESWDNCIHAFMNDKQQKPNSIFQWIGVFNYRRGEQVIGDIAESFPLGNKTKHEMWKELLRKGAGFFAIHNGIVYWGRNRFDFFALGRADNQTAPEDRMDGYQINPVWQELCMTNLAPNTRFIQTPDNDLGNPQLPYPEQIINQTLQQQAQVQLQEDFDNKIIHEIKNRQKDALENRIVNQADLENQSLEAIRQSRTLGKTKNVEQTLQTKTRILELIKQQENETSIVIENLFTFIFIVSLSIFPLILYWAGRISKVLTISIVIFIILFAVVFIYIRNYRRRPKYYPYDPDNPETQNDLTAIQNYLQSQMEEINQNLAEDIYTNCHCPVSFAQSGKQKTPISTGPDTEYTAPQKIPTMKITHAPSGLTEQISPVLTGHDLYERGNKTAGTITTGTVDNPMIQENLYDFIRFFVKKGVPEEQLKTGDTYDTIKRLHQLCIHAPAKNFYANMDANTDANTDKQMSVPDFVYLLLQNIYRDDSYLTPENIANISQVYIDNKNMTPTDLRTYVMETPEFKKRFGTVQNWFNFVEKNPYLESLYNEKYRPMQ